MAIDQTYSSSTGSTSVAGNSVTCIGSGDGVTVPICAFGSGTALGSGQYALNISITGADVADVGLSLLFSEASAITSIYTQPRDFILSDPAGWIYGYSDGASVNTSDTQSASIPSSFSVALLIDTTTGTWGYVDDSGVLHSDVGALPNASPPPADIGEATGTLYWRVAATGVSSSASFAIGATVLTSNISGVPSGYTAIGGSMATSQTTTALSLINQAFSLLGVLAAGETLSAEEADTGLDILNNMLDSWNLERLNIYTVQDHTATLSGQTLTIGPGADIDVDRPIRLDERCFTRINGIDYGMKVVNGDQYASLVLKTLTSTYPYYVFYDGNVPTGTLYFWPQPPAPVEVHMRLWNQIQQFTSVSDAVYLPQGYRRAIIYSLAEELAPQFRNLDPNISVIASKARRNIKRANLQDNVLNVPNGLINRGRRFNIYTGE